MIVHTWRLGVLAALLGLISGCSNDASGEIKTTPTRGIRYLDLVEGDGQPAKVGDGLYFAYKSWLANGTPVQSADREKPAIIRLGFCQPIVGLDEGLEGMKVNGKRKIWVPAQYGYGARGSPPLIPENADLVFEVELVEIVTAEQAKKMALDVSKAKSAADKALLEALRAQDSKPATGKDVPEKERKEITTFTGLKYMDFRIGEGREAVPGSVVVVNYMGYLPDKTTFDAKLDPKDPFVFLLGGGKVIQGWDEGLVGMKAGGKRQLIVPARLGYGSKAMGKIPPDSTLIFDIELLRVH
jgi:peptidylprolyl isomerase